jgi:hypothetical protein
MRRSAPKKFLTNEAAPADGLSRLTTSGFLDGVGDPSTFKNFPNSVSASTATAMARWCAERLCWLVLDCPHTAG